MSSVVGYLNSAIDYANYMSIPWDFQYRNSLSKYANSGWETSIIAKTRDSLGDGGNFIGNIKDEFKLEVGKIPKNEIPKKEDIRTQIKVS